MRLRPERDGSAGNLGAGGYLQFRGSLLSDEFISANAGKLRRRTRERLGDEIANLVDAVSKGLLSPTLAKRLQGAEAELAALPAPPTVIRVDDVLKRLPEAVARYRRMTAQLGDAPIDVQRGRELLRGLLGEIRIAPRDGYLVAKMGLGAQPLSVSSIRGSGGSISDFRISPVPFRFELRGD